MYGIEESIYIKLHMYFKSNTYIKKVILFGSRAKGSYKYNSDIDIGILCDKKYKGTISEELNELVGLYSLDIIFLDSMNEEIKLQLDRDGVEIYNSFSES